MFNLEIGNEAKKAQKFIPVHPNPAIGTEHDLSLMLFGMHSPRYKDALVKFTRSRMKLLKDRAKEEGIELEDTELTLDEAYQFASEMIADCCESYTGAGDQAKLTDKEKKQGLIDTLSSEDYSWLRVQCESFSRIDDNFFLKPTKK